METEQSLKEARKKKGPETHEVVGDGADPGPEGRYEVLNLM
jgi:hypothetical protein